EAARERFRQVLEISPEFTVAHSGMAQVERRAGHIEEAREWWQRAMRINPKRAYYPAGVALLELDEDDIDAAERALRQAESLAPNDVQVVRTRVALLVATGRDAELCGYTEGRLQGERSSDEALANAALAQLVAGHPKDALGYYRRVRGDLRQWVSDSLLWTWRFPHALYYAQALLATEAREPALALLADAERLFARLVEEGLVNPELDYERAMVLAMREDHDGAARAIERARADGWRAAWLARRDPTLAALRARGGRPASRRWRSWPMPGACSRGSWRRASSIPSWTTNVRWCSRCARTTTALRAPSSAPAPTAGAPRGSPAATRRWPRCVRAA